MTSEKDRVNFHKTLRNLLLEEIERIEKEQTDKESNMAQWREHFMRETQQEMQDMNNNIVQLQEQNAELQVCY